MVDDDVFTAVDALDAALRVGDFDAAVNLWAMDDKDVAIVGSAAGEWFLGPVAVRECLAAITSRATKHGWRWVDRRVKLHGDVAWVVAEAPFQTIHADGTVAERPYRVTGVLVRRSGDWRWHQYHGSEPLGSIG